MPMANPYEAPQAMSGFPVGTPPGADVPTYLVQSILVMLFCCQPFGIVAVVFAAIASGKLSSGDYHGALAASNNARKWCTIAFFLGIVPVLIGIVMALSGGLRHFR
jgi:hypothetical protein